MPPLKNTLSWSHSRDKLFRECPRAYYWNYYGSWEGWRRVALDEARLAYRLKQMTTLPMWAGEVVHQTIENGLRSVRSGRRPAADALQEEARRLLNYGWAQSVGKHWRRDPKRSTNLFEHYYGGGVTKDERAALRERVFSCLERFCGSETLAMLEAAGPENWVALEELSQFDVGGTPVWVKLDVAARRDGEWVICDWKSGSPGGDDAAQIRTYALYAMAQWQAAPEAIVARLVYLKDGDEKVLRAEPSELIAHRETILASIGQMRARLSDPDNNVADREDFPMIEDLSVCARCNFKQLCGR